MQNFNNFVSTRHFFINKICQLFLLSVLVLLQFSFLRAQSSTQSIQNPAISNQIDRLLQQKMDPQDVDLWINLNVPKAAYPGDRITVELKISETSVFQFSDIYIVFLAPNSYLKSLGESLYTKFGGIISMDSNTTEIKNIITDSSGYLDSLKFLIPKLPAIIGTDTTDTITIKFSLILEDTLIGNAALFHMVTCYQLHDDKIVNLNFDSERTDILQKPKFFLQKVALKDPSVQQGDTIDYKIIIGNTGGDDADSVLIRDYLPAGLNFVKFLTPDQANNRNYNEQDRLLEWFFLRIPVDSFKEVNYRALVTATYHSVKDTVNIDNIVQIKHGDTFPGATMERVFIAPPVFELKKEIIGNSSVSFGDTLDFKITLENKGKFGVDSVLIQDPLPPSLNFLSFLSPHADSEYVNPAQTLNWYFDSVLPNSIKEMNFRAVVLGNLTFEGEKDTVLNKAIVKHRNLIFTKDSAKVIIINPPDLVPKINSIKKPDDWKLTDGIGVGIESSVLNIGGQPFRNDFKIRYWYELLDNPTVTKQWEIDVRPGPTGIPGGMKMTDTGYPIEIQKTKLMFGGVYRFCMKIIPTILPPDYSVEKDTTNNQVCILDTIKVPLRFFLSKNVYEPTKIGAPLDLIFQIPGQTDVKINIYNVAGEFIKKQVDESFTTEGIYTRQWDGKNKDGNLVASGVYVCALESSAGHVTRKVIVVR